MLLQRSTLPSAFRSCPFVAGPMITCTELFVGRKEALHTMTNAMVGAQPTSLNIVGERRVGKSSLLYHFYLTWQQHVCDRDHYVVIFLSLQDARCQNRASFYQCIVQTLVQHPHVQRKKSLSATLQGISTIDHASFAQVLEVFKQHRILPVLCLDEFEVLFKYHSEFDDQFYDHLRSLVDRNVLMLIVTSHKSLDYYREGDSVTSTFFNNGQTYHLDVFTDAEADELLLLPASTVAGVQPALRVDEQVLARQWAGQHPYLLQLAAHSLCLARLEGKALDKARERFTIEQRRLFEPAMPAPVTVLPTVARWLLWSLPIRIGRLSRYAGNHFEDVKAWVMGIVVVVVLALLLLGLVKVSQVLSLLMK